jgi:hypothetical protein
MTAPQKHMKPKPASKGDFRFYHKTKAHLTVSPSGPDGGYESVSLSLTVTLRSGGTIEMEFADVIDSKFYLGGNEDLESIAPQTIRRNILSSVTIEYSVDKANQRTVTFEAQISKRRRLWQSSSTVEIKRFKKNDILGKTAKEIKGLFLA